MGVKGPYKASWCVRHWSSASGDHTSGLGVKLPTRCITYTQRDALDEALTGLKECAGGENLYGQDLQGAEDKAVAIKPRSFAKCRIYWN